MKKYKIEKFRKMLKKKEKMVVNLETFTWNACFVQEASKKFWGQGILTWVGRVTGNDNIFFGRPYEPTVQTAQKTRTTVLMSLFFIPISDKQK